MKKTVKITGIIVGGIILAVISCIVYVKVFLPNVSQAPAIAIKVTPELIERGKYMANNVMVCMDCHSTRNWNEFSGPLVNGTLGKGGDVFDASMGFPGVYYASNITPAGIGNYSDGEIFRAITCGVKKNGDPIFPVMPHANYGLLDKEDIKAVIAYIRTIEPIENKVPSSHSDFPMNIIINTMPKEAALSKRPDKHQAVAYGGYLVNAAACRDCHTPFEKGSYDAERILAGGRQFKMPGGTLTSSNLTPDNETGIGQWSQDAFIRRFTIYRDSAAAHQNIDPQKDFNTIMPWTMYANMTDEDLGAIYQYLKTLKPNHNPTIKFTSAN